LEDQDEEMKADAWWTNEGKI